MLILSNESNEKGVWNDAGHFIAFITIPPVYIGWRIWKFVKKDKKETPPVTPPKDPKNDETPPATDT